METIEREMYVEADGHTGNIVGNKLYSFKAGCDYSIVNRYNFSKKVSTVSFDDEIFVIGKYKKKIKISPNWYNLPGIGKIREVYAIKKKDEYDLITNNGAELVASLDHISTVEVFNVISDGKFLYPVVDKKFEVVKFSDNREMAVKEAMSKLTEEEQKLLGLY